MHPLLWLLLDGIGVMGLMMHLALCTGLAQFRIGRLNPVDFCRIMENRVVLLMLQKTLVSVLSTMDVKLGWPILLVHVGILWYFLRRRIARGRVFDPYTIARETGVMRRKELVFAVLICSSVLYAMGVTLYLVLSR
jgi:hypothetical protein